MGAQAIQIINSNMTTGGEAHGGLVGNLMSVLNNALNGGGQDLYEGGMTLDQIMQQIVENDPNRYGPPPASKDAIKQLPKGKYSDFFPKEEENKENDKKDENKSCGICYDEYSPDDDTQLLQLP